jgi:hypothetical protein
MLFRNYEFPENKFSGNYVLLRGLLYPFFQSLIKFHVIDQNVILLSNVCFLKTTALIATVSLWA